MTGRKTIVYAGGFVLPAGNASAQRALENSRLFKSLGYEVVVVGQLASTHEAEIEGLRCINIHAPDGRQNYPYYKNDSRSVVSAIEQVGPDKVHALIAYNYPARPLAGLIRYGSRHGIKVVVECTEWYGWEGKRLLHNLRQLAGTELRIRVLARRAGNVICASGWGASVFDGLNVLRLPFVIDETAAKWTVDACPKPGRGRRLVYAGNPGQGLFKDYLHLTIAALAKLAREGADFDFQVAGVTAGDVLKSFPGLASDIAALGERITFHGRLPHTEALSLLKSADFSLFVRPDNRVSRFGFPTKVAEAFACGVPTITTPTSDIPKYVRDGETGFLLAGTDAASIAAGLSRALGLSEDEMTAMKARCRDNPFAPARFEQAVGAFLAELR